MLSRVAVCACTAVIAFPVVLRGEEGPGRRYGHELVYDESRGVTILFGGFDEAGNPKGDTWSWSGSSWTRVAEEGPSPRRWPAMAYDSRRERLVLHGGRGGTGRSGPSLADSWAWDGTRWERLETSDGPPGRDHHRMAYDRKRDRIVLFGGWDGERVVGDTWELDGAGWHELELTSPGSESPAPRAPFGLVYDEAREEVLLFGGRNLEGSFGDTWRFRGESWERLEPDGALPPRAFHGATYDPDERRILVFGGRDDETLLTDTWAWDGSRWIFLSEEGPVRRGVYALTYDRRRRVALFHGSGVNEHGRWQLSNETWLWNGARWSVSHR